MKLIRYFMLTAVLCTATALAVGESEMHSAAQDGDLEKVKSLITQGANVNERDKQFGRTPLNWAVRNERSSTVIAFLLANGADINAQDTDNGFTPLHWASSNKDITRLLLARGANVEARDRLGNTPLDLAVNGNKLDVADLLETHIVSRSQNPSEQLNQLVAQLKEKPKDATTRRLILRLAPRVRLTPALPEEARRYFVEGSAIARAAKAPEQARLAVDSFKKATTIAPWWAEAYYNLGVAQELAKQYDDAAMSFQFYLLSKPSEKEAREVQDRIYAIGAKKKLGQ